jgi:hypothetical protein
MGITNKLLKKQVVNGIIILDLIISTDNYEIAYKIDKIMNTYIYIQVKNIKLTSPLRKQNNRATTKPCNITNNMV